MQLTQIIVECTKECYWLRNIEVLFASLRGREKWGQQGGTYVIDTSHYVYEISGRQNESQTEASSEERNGTF